MDLSLPIRPRPSVSVFFRPLTEKEGERTIRRACPLQAAFPACHPLARLPDLPCLSLPGLHFLPLSQPDCIRFPHLDLEPNFDFPSTGLTISFELGLRELTLEVLMARGIVRKSLVKIRPFFGCALGVIWLNHRKPN